MNLSLALKRIKWGLKGIQEYGFKDFRIIGLYCIDYMKITGETFTASGWAFSFTPLVECPILEILDSDNVVYRQALNFKESIEAASYLHFSEDPKAGFYLNLEYRSSRDLQARIVFFTNKNNYYLHLGTLKANRKVSNEIKVLNPWNDHQIGRVELGFTQLNPFPKHNTRSNLSTNLVVDIIIPVYNGYEFLPRLFETIDRTEIEHRVFIINDASPDPRVGEIINDYLNNNSNAIVYDNEVNLGFLGSANKGLELSTNHAVIVNTDVELPDQWLERIIAPILNDNTIASATPFTNSGTICSFPNFLEDNPIPEGMSVDEIDSFFKNMIPVYTEIPTGVGFCMAMNRKALNDIGLFDGEAFGRGYGEENDWCQRAISHGYKNVMVENLFVYHKHGGSFDSEEKVTLYKEHEEILKQRHPDYFADVARFCTENPLLQFRNYVYARIKSYKVDNPILVFSHLLGGGAADFLTREFDKLADNNTPYALFSYSPEESLYHIQVFKKKLLFQFESTSLTAALSTFDSPSELWINELATYPHLPETLKVLSDYIFNTNLKTKFFLHDYFCLCPSINLLNDRDCYCGLPNTPMKCERCYESQKFIEGGFGESIKAYRANWQRLLEHCDIVECFSRSSEDLFHRIFPDINTHLSPHSITPLPSISTDSYNHNGLNIGFLGNITKHKGAEIIRGLADLSLNDSVKLIVIGSIADKYRTSNIKVTGDYSLNDLPNLIKEEQIDIFFIPSIWPETFSFTSSEVISTGLPVAVFDIGAPAERVANYSKGLVIPINTNLDSILDLLKKHADKWKELNERQ